jgi:TrkA domain protein
VDIAYSTVPGTGAVHHFRTRGGQQFGVLVERAGRRSLLVYDADDPDDADVPVWTIVLEQDEADQIAEILHSRSLPDGLADWPSSPGLRHDRNRRCSRRSPSGTTTMTRMVPAVADRDVVAHPMPVRRCPRTTGSEIVVPRGDRAARCVC